MNHEQPPVPRRPSPELTAHIGKATVILTFENTGLHIYPKNLQHFCHIRISDPSIPDAPVFDQPHLLYDLYVLDYPFIWLPNVEDEVVEAYVAWQATRLAGELDDPWR